MAVLNATYSISEHPCGLELRISDGCETMVLVISPEQWDDMKTGGDRVLRRSGGRARRNRTRR
jgi:hypothetical protein